MGQETQVRRSFMRSLLRDKTANTIAISAAAMVPLMAMVGGGIDASRYYMAASRMQAACDAGALAARRSMLDDEFRAEDRQVGLNFFDQNFNDGMFSSTDRTRDYASEGDGVVTGTASGKLPTTIMGAFGYDEFELSVSCSAEINISNTDIMFVLDVTGSMNCPDTNIAGCVNGNNNNTEVANSLIVGLRAAVVNFYDTVETATSPNAQVRYGFVPYAPNVNVGFSLPRAFMANTHTYQSRVPRFHNVTTFQPYSDTVENLPKVITNLGSTNQSDYRFRNANNNPNASNSTDAALCESLDGKTYWVGPEQWQVLSDTYTLNVFTTGSNNDRAGCRGRVRKLRETTTLQFRDYVYCPVTTGVANQCGSANPTGSPAGWETVNLSTLYDDNRIMTPTGTSGAMEQLTWNGCIEEAASVNSATWNPVPNNAFDLDINLVPATEAQRWKPMLRDAVFRRLDSGNNRQLSNRTTTTDLANPTHDCPTAALRLAEMDRGEVTTYVNGLRARGSTYHDIGMIWGARFISPRGIFQADNESAPNGDAIGRHIVFMTDGLLAPNVDLYGTYGMEWWDRRVTTNGSTDQKARHEARFQAACRAARQENITIWAVSFGEALSPELVSCASPGRAYEARNNAELTEAFQEIAQKIAALRLTS